MFPRLIEFNCLWGIKSNLQYESLVNSHFPSLCEEALKTENAYSERFDFCIGNKESEPQSTQLYQNKLCEENIST